jgi:hypothetical protein
MKRKIIIDLQKDSKIDASLEELELIRDIVNDSIRLKRKEEKRKKPTENLLFDVPVKEDKPKLFANSKCFDFQVFSSELSEEAKLDVNLFYYYNSIKDWSSIKTKVFRTDKGWIATARTWMRQDQEKGKLKMLTGDTMPMSNKDELEYLNT